MKTTKTLLTTMAAAIACSMTAYAEGDGNKPKRADRARKGPPKEIIEKFDKDGDGKLNDEERAAAKAEMKKRRAAAKAKMLERFDTDKDGKLSDEEKTAMKAAIAKERKEIRAAVLAKFDKDGDGKLDADEREGVREWVRETYPNAIHMRPGGKRGPHARGPRGKGRKGPGKGPRGKKRAGAE